MDFTDFAKKEVKTFMIFKNFFQPGDVIKLKSVGNKKISFIVLFLRAV